jgi:hypothetical protein
LDKNLLNIKNTIEYVISPDYKINYNNNIDKGAINNYNDFFQFSAHPFKNKVFNTNILISELNNETNGQFENIKNSNIKINSTLNKTNMSANINMINSSINGITNTIDFNVVSAPSKNIQIQASLANRDSDLMGQDTISNIKIVSPINKKMNVAINMLEHPSIGTRNNDVKLESSFIKNCLMSLSYNVFDNGVDQFQSNTFNLVYAPNKIIKTTAFYKTRKYNNNTSNVNSYNYKIMLFPQNFWNINMELGQNPEIQPNLINYYNNRSYGIS